MATANTGQLQKGFTPWNKGKECPQTAGEKNGKWIQDRTQVKQYWTERNNPEYKQWRKNVLRIYDHRCIACGEAGFTEADHKYSWAKFPRLRYMIENGQALCRECHKRKTAMERGGIETVSIY